MKKNLGVTALVVLVAIFAFALGSQNTSITEVVEPEEAAAEPSPSPSPSPTKEAVIIQQEEKEEVKGTAFDFETLALKCDVLDQIQFVARVTNNSGEDFDSVGFLVTFTNQGTGEFMGTGTGSVGGLPNDQSRTIEFYSMDDCVPDAMVDIEFQVEYAY